ncbi:glyco_like_mftF, transferase 2, rSAM/selenodomain-associated [uncultured Caudovirales phage]|uniref:Glyco_like_mftF, transferase 2, rSAM/selenodomain-associated n=1 Tax=uncultured Caudovirales phage TaxID=2100421 RepID=A0A6J5M9A8_9CAUD|nr:glyco_like_mftF, transferase 2, rSAM/selenodomain-associated [uncultured Caudovirales phage]
MNELLTVVIPCKNEGFGVLDVIRKLDHKYEVIVADSSTDKVTAGLLENYSNIRPNVKVITGGLPSVARNNGAKLVTTPYVLFLDADIYIKDKTILPYCIKTIHETELDLVTIKLTTFERRYRWIYKLFNLVQLFTAHTKPFAVGGFMLFRTETFRKLGGFNESDKIAEDYHLSMKVHPDKFRVLNKTAWTPGRRFKNKGFFYMAKLAIKCWLNRNNDKFFTNDQNYWK